MKNRLKKSQLNFFFFYVNVWSRAYTKICCIVRSLTHSLELSSILFSFLFLCSDCTLFGCRHFARFARLFSDFESVRNFICSLLCSLHSHPTYIMRTLPFDCFSDFIYAWNAVVTEFFFFDLVLLRLWSLLPFDAFGYQLLISISWSELCACVCFVWKRRFAFPFVWSLIIWIFMRIIYWWNWRSVWDGKFFFSFPFFSHFQQLLRLLLQSLWF